MFGSVELREFFDELEWEIGKSKLKPRFWLHKLCKYVCSFPEMWRAGRGADLGWEHV